MIIEFTNPIWFWHGPSPFYFVTVPQEQSRDIKAIAHLVTYGWGMIPVVAHTGETEWKTAMFEKDGCYILPLKATVRKAEELNEGDQIIVRLEIRI